ncbi:hypothetical protein FOA52_006007 [Chlamydomonas sp. UWO 241]|nr:hypothetical protein FOA52_006007 [Chlamydomonas sp. UWO 241]
MLPIDASAPVDPMAQQPVAYVRAEGSSGTAEFVEYLPSSKGSGSRMASRMDAAHAPSAAHGAKSVPTAAAPLLLPPPAWHSHRPMLAAADASGRVHVYDTAGVDAQCAPGSGRAPPAATQQPSLTLQHELQASVASLAWRPRAGGCLAVGTRGRVALWHVSGSARAPAPGARSAAVQGPWLVLLRAPSAAAHITDLAWSPDGALLAASSPSLPGLIVWDVASGRSERVGAASARLSCLRWSPDGNYLFTGSATGRFYLFETARWGVASWDPPSVAGSRAGAIRSIAGACASALSSALARADGAAAARAARAGAPWHARVASAALGLMCAGAQTVAGWAEPASSLSAGRSHQPPPGSLANACWSPTSSVLLLGYVGSPMLLSLHLVGPPPSLTAHVMPVSLPDVHVACAAATSSGGSGVGGEHVSLVDFVWERSGERLGVVLASPSAAAGTLAVFATTCDPVVSARLLGFARPPPDCQSLSNAGSGVGCVDGGGVDGGGSGAGMGAWGLAAHQCFGPGALLTVATGGRQLYNLPLLWR